MIRVYDPRMHGRYRGTVPPKGRATIYKESDRNPNRVPVGFVPTQPDWGEGTWAARDVVCRLTAVATLPIGAGDAYPKT